MFKGPLTHLFPISHFLDHVQLSSEPKVLSFRFWLLSFSSLSLLIVSVSARFASILWIPPGGSSVLPNPIVFIKDCWADETVDCLKSYLRHWRYTFDECRQSLVIDPCSKVVHLLYPIQLPWTKTQVRLPETTSMWSKILRRYRASWSRLQIPMFPCSTYHPLSSYQWFVWSIHRMMHHSLIDCIGLPREQTLQRAASLPQVASRNLTMVTNGRWIYRLWTISKNLENNIPN